LRLRSALIAAKDPQTGQRIYLNAEYLGAEATSDKLVLKDRDDQAAADLDDFIYLELKR
jgi:hypothetical protein